MINYYIGEKLEVYTIQVVIFFLNNTNVNHHKKVKSIIEVANYLTILC